MGPLSFKFSQPSKGATKQSGRGAFVAAILGDGAARDGPFEVVQEPGERSSRL